MSMLEDVFRSLGEHEPGLGHAISAKEWVEGQAATSPDYEYVVWRDTRTDMYVIARPDANGVADPDGAFSDFQRIR